MFTAWRGREEQGRRNKRGPSASTHEEQRARRAFFSAALGQECGQKIGILGGRDRNDALAPTAVEEERGTVNSSLPGSAERRRTDFRPCLLSSLPPKCSKLRVRLAEAFTRRKGRKTLGEFSPSPPPPYFFRPICHPTHLGGIERKSKWREDRVNNLSEKLKKNCLLGVHVRVF